MTRKIAAAVGIALLLLVTGHGTADAVIKSHTPSTVIKSH